jgi:UDP-N-acetylmuramoyl-tripeptide--D-alanyl-D-alanine ligase
MLSLALLRSTSRLLGWNSFGVLPKSVSGVGTDSRLPLTGQLFVALVGESFDGHGFVDRAVEQGASALLVQRLHSARIARQHPNLYVIGVEDTLYALGELARLARQQDSRRLIAITGSAGKTSTRMACVAAAQAAGLQVHQQPGNENNRIGVPRFLLNLPALQKSEELIVVECGTSEPGEIARLGAICSPDIAVVTEVCAAHTELLIDEDGVAHEKGDLLRAAHKSLGLAIFDTADSRLLEAAKQGGRRVLPLYDLQHATSWEGAAEHLRANGSKVLSALQALGIELTLQVIAAARLLPPPGRGGLISIGDWTVMDDSYNANEASMRAALLAAAEAAGNRPLVCFLGEMRELGDHAQEAHRSVARQAVAAGAKFLFFTGPYASISAAEAQGAGAIQVIAAPDASDLLEQVGELPASAFILVKGSRGARMERVIVALKDAH